MTYRGKIVFEEVEEFGPELVPQAPRRTVGWWFGLAATLAMSGAAAWFGWHVWWERDVTKRVEKAGGSVQVATVGPEWLVRRAPAVYRDTVTRVTVVRVQKTAVSDELVRAIAGRSGISSLNLDDTTLTDAQFAELAAGLPGLRSLSVRNTKLTDASAEHVAGLTGLRVADLTGVALSEAAAGRIRAALPDAIVYTTPARENTQDEGPLVEPGGKRRGG